MPKDDAATDISLSAQEGPGDPAAENQALTVAEAVEEAEAVEVSRDERHDSIDAATGTLTDEAVALRAERGISQTGLQHEAEAAEAADAATE